MPLNRDSSTPDSAELPRLRGEALFAGYNGRQVLADVHFTVQDGSVTVLLGPNGSGKSTLLKTLARTLAPDAGKVILDGTLDDLMTSDDPRIKQFRTGDLKGPGGGATSTEDYHRDLLM